MKDYWIKQLVNLKRRPQIIPTVLLTLSCMIYTFRLTAHSNAAMYVSNQIIALYVFIITLASMLSIISYLNAYPKGRVKPLMLVVVLVLLAVQILLEALYLDIMFYETMERANPVPVTQDIADSMNWVMVHLAALAVSTLSVVLLPIYRNLLRRINIQIVDDEANDFDAEEPLIEEEKDEFVD